MHEKGHLRLKYKLNGMKTRNDSLGYPHFCAVLTGIANKVASR